MAISGAGLPPAGEADGDIYAAIAEQTPPRRAASTSLLTLETTSLAAENSMV